MSDALRYRPAIDGLRAIAVLSVFVFHLSHAWLPGGFVGVDVFFVISGYLISSIILGSCDAGKFTLVRFYQRRIARIFPLLSVVALATGIAAIVIYADQDRASAGANLAAAAASLANMKYMLQSSYFQISADAQPYLHFWSLSVEEQFYLVYPVVVWVLRTRLRMIRGLTWWVLAGAFVVSLGLCVGVTMWRPTWAFYLLPTRGWELLAGGLLALRDVERASRGADGTAGRLDGALAWVGLAMIGASFVVIHGGATFPGFIATLPVVGSVLVIANRAGAASSAERLLGTRPMVWVGKISYSLYLWHWPVFALTDYALYQESMWVRLAIKVVLSFGLSVGTFFLVEGPSRRFLNERKHRGIAYATLAVSVAGLVMGGVWMRRHYFPSASLESLATGGIEFGGAEREGGASVMLIGDSHALMHARAVQEATRLTSSRFWSLAVANANPLPDPSDDPPREWADSLTAVETLRPDVVVYVMAWKRKLEDDPEPARRAIDALLARCDRLVLITQPPLMPEGGTREGVREGHPLPFVEDPEYREKRLRLNEFLRSVASDRVTVIDIEDLFGRADGSIVHAGVDGRFYYHDDDHLSSVGAGLVVPRLVEAIRR